MVYVTTRRTRRVLLVLLATALVGGTCAPPRANGAINSIAAVLVFPKVVADGTYDTVIQVVNSSDQSATTRCVYLNATRQDPAAPPGPSNPPVWEVTHFALPFVKQQPISWVLGQGHVTIGGTAQINPCCDEVPAVPTPFQ